MKIGITGLANSGKTTIFNALTGKGVETTLYPSAGGEPNVGVVKVPDPRVGRLSEIFRPGKTTYSTVQYVDYIGLIKGDMKQNSSVLEFIKDADALLHVVRAFRDDSVMHPLGGVDPLRDAATLEGELLFGDLDLVERRLEGIEGARKKGLKPDEEERGALLGCRAAIEDGTALRDVEFTADELAALRHLQFMSMKPETVVINVGEGDLKSPGAGEIEGKVREFYAGKPSVGVMLLSGKIEMEIAELPPGEAGAFLDDLGIGEPALDRLIRASYENVGLISFFTVLGDEVRSWTVRRGADALEAAGKVHTDIQRGFIRAEVIAYDEFIKLGSMGEARDRGLLRLEGKTYTVRDGDIINFRFNV
jgi:GTP-binding protein YchF